MLTKLFRENIPGQKIHDRNMKHAFTGLSKKLSVNHFHQKAQSVSGHEVTSNHGDSSELFDSTGAANLMQSKMTQSKMNSLFQDTRMFNVSSAQYNSNFSKPGALELLDKDYD